VALAIPHPVTKLAFQGLFEQLSQADALPVILPIAPEHTCMHHLNGYFSGKPGLAGCPLKVPYQSEFLYR